MNVPAKPSADILSPELFGNGIPHDLLAELRNHSPVVWLDEPAHGAFSGGPGYWLVLRHADVSHVSRSPMIFSSWQGTSFLRDPKPSDVAVPRRMMLNMDPPEHTKLRKIVNRAFTPQAIRRQLADSITRHARDVVDSVCELGKIDFLTDVAAEMPLRVLADVLGVPTEDRHLLYKWTNALVGLDDPEYGDPQAFLAAFVEMFSYARQRTAEKRARPGDDVWSTIVTAEVDGERLSDDDLDRFFQLLVIAGNDTTRNLIANTLLTLSSHPGQLARLRADLGLIPSAIEEVLRYAPSVIQFRRTATQDAELAGQQISAGDKVIINYASANRDEAVFADPDRFDIGRDPTPRHRPPAWRPRTTASAALRPPHRRRRRPAPATARPCWPCTARTSARPKKPPNKSPHGQPSWGSAQMSPPWTTTSMICHATGRSPSSPPPTTAHPPTTPSASRGGSPKTIRT